MVISPVFPDSGAKCRVVPDIVAVTVPRSNVVEVSVKVAASSAKVWIAVTLKPQNARHIAAITATHLLSGVTLSLSLSLSQILIH